MAYYSKYTGAELEEKLDKVEEIPQLIAQMISGRDFVTKEDLLCVLRDYAPADYSTIPIDHNTIYWENGVLKAIGGGSGSCQWELKEHNGVQYLFSRLPVVTQYDVTMYADVNRLDLPSIYDGLPIDWETIYWEETEDGKVLKAKSIGGSGATVDANWVISIINNAGYVTESWIYQQNFIDSTFLNNALQDYIPIAGLTNVTGDKNFLGGLRVNNSPSIFYDESKKYWKLEGDLLITGGLTQYGSDSQFIPSTIMDGIITDDKTISKKNGYLEVIGGTGEGSTTVQDATYTTKGIASFNPSSFIVNNGAVNLKTKIVISSGTPSTFNSDTLYIIT